MSTSAQISPAWKQEVNRRLAEHRGRKGSPAAEQKTSAEVQHNASRRAVEAAARVAARYANAPSYNEVLASEARAALRAAEEASRAALHAQAAAESVLAGIEAATASEAALEPIAEMRFAAPLAMPEPDTAFSNDEFFWSEPATEPEPELWPKRPWAGASAVRAGAPVPVQQPISVRWDTALPAQRQQPVEARAARGQDLFATGAEDWWRPAFAEPELGESEQIEVVEPVQPIPANLIEFPRELVATRKARPRLVEALSAPPEAGTQLSIFEVDPVSLSAGPALEMAAASAQAWTWSGIELDAHPVHEIYEALPEPESQGEAAAPALEPAPATQRIMAMVVDGALIAGSVLGGAVMAATRASVLPGLRTTEIGLGVALVVTAALYEMLFLMLGRSTPGMRYAQIRLTTFEGLLPARGERCKRLAALLVSALPAGLGLAWSLFDDDHLAWHDRLSRTYLCKR